jgi:TM2 domain-containing membrane protein YozV
MKCFYHSDIEGKYECSKCGKEIYEECVYVNGKEALCEKCYESLKGNNVNYDYNKFWAFLFSLIPGIGRMYLGFMEQGLLMMVVFLGSIMLGNTIPYMPLVILVAWFYSFFDVYHLKKKIANGEIITDKNILDFKVKRSYVAYGLIILGGIILFNEVLGHFYFTTLSYGERKLIRSFVVSTILIVIGVILLKRVKKSVETSDENDEQNIEDTVCDKEYTNCNEHVEGDITIE